MNSNQKNTNSKIKKAFQDQKAFIAYLMAGDPNLEKTKAYILAMEQAGADLIEIGIPFSDPIAEGPVIQKANLRALAADTNLEKIFAMLASIKDTVTIPLLFMTYLNPVFNYGYEAFCEKCQACGISGLIIPDMPFEEQGELLPATQKHDLDLISLIAPTSDARIATVAKTAQGFLYLVSSLGVTGERNQITTDLSAITAKIKAHTDTPVAVGFGIHTPDQAAAIAKAADGVIVGSAIVRLIEEHGTEAAEPLAQYIKSMKDSI